MPIQLLTCKLAEGNTTLPAYAEASRSAMPDTVSRLCRCSSNTDAPRLSRVGSEDGHSIETVTIGDAQYPPEYSSRVQSIEDSGS
jgi:hypothetical protein